MATVTGRLGTSGSSTYFDSIISLGVTLDDNVYPNGTITFDDLSSTTAYFHNGHVDNQVLKLYLCDSSGNNAVQFAQITVPGNGNVTSLSGTVSGAQALAGKALYLKATGTSLAISRVYFRNKTDITITTATNYFYITLRQTNHGTLTASKSKAAEGATVTLYPEPAAGYECTGFITDPHVSINSSNRFAMPASDITVSATFALKSYTVTTKVSPSGAGQLTASPSSATKNTQITLTPTAADGYVFKKYSSSPSVTISSNNFTMPASNVTVTASFYKLSTPTLSNKTLTGGGVVTLTISTESTAYAHRYRFYDPDNNDLTTSWTSVAAGKTSVVIQVPSETWLNKVTNATSKSGLQLQLDTIVSGTNIGRRTLTGLTFVIPDGVYPDVGTLTTAPALTIGGVTYHNPGNGIYTQNHCGVTIQAAASGVYGSTITSLKVTMSGYSGSSYSKTVSAASMSLTSGKLTISGTTTITAVATDSRGRTCTRTTTISVTKYNPPSGTLSVTRVNAGGTADPYGQYATYAITKSFTAVGDNTLRTVSLTAVGATESLSSDTGDILPVARKTFSTEADFTITLTLADWFETTVINTKLPSARYIIYVSEDGYHLCFEKAATQATPTGKNGTIEFNGDYQIYIGSTKLEDYIKAQIAVANNLTTTAAGYVLDARQGKALKDEITKNTTPIGRNYSTGFNFYRAGNTVMCSCYSGAYTCPSNNSYLRLSGSSTPLGAIPDGFKPVMSLNIFETNAQKRLALVNDEYGWRFTGPVAFTDANLRFTCVWVTMDDFPT